MRRWLLIAGGMIAAGLLFFLLRPEDEESTPPLERTTTTSSEPTVSTRTAATPRPQRTVVRIAVREGRVVGGPRVHRVAKGRRVVIIVRSNVADEVHVHGYNLRGNVPAGGIARIEFRATLAGRFEMELEEHRLPLGELEVLP